MKLKSCKHQSFEKVEKKNEERKKKEPVSVICLMNFLIVVLTLQKQYCKIISYFQNIIYGIFQIDKNKLLNMKVEIFM